MSGTKQDETCTSVHICAGDSVACLERVWRDSGSGRAVPASMALLLPLETISAKEAKELYRPPGKSPRLFERGICEIAVQT